jgi:hypothetical protein
MGRETGMMEYWNGGMMEDWMQAAGYEFSELKKVDRMGEFLYNTPWPVGQPRTR